VLKSSNETAIPLQKTTYKFLKNEEVESWKFMSTDFRALIAHDLVLRRELK
jgi:hypothetical protein